MRIIVPFDNLRDTYIYNMYTEALGRLKRYLFTLLEMKRFILYGIM